MASYAHHMGVFLSKDHVRIFHQSWQVENPKGIIVISHGIGEHSGRYHNLLRALTGKGISIYASDHRGSGLSGGVRGHVDDFSKFYKDIKYMVDTVIKKDHPDVPVILLGHSLGGLIAELYALSYPGDLAALILSAPALMPIVDVPPWKKTLGKLVSNILPTVTMSNEIDPYHLSTDKSVVQAYLDDPLVHDQVSAQFYQEYLKATAQGMKRANELAMPLLLIHGTEDKMVSIKSSRHIYKEAVSPDKTLEEFDGLFHETMNEVEGEREKVLHTMVEWILTRI